ncbi:MAG: AAA family ATPase [Methylomicrobium sp.]|nr:AAA family ATPase [Methylomicrobium sp.]
MSMITCQLCAAQVHSIQLHLRDEHSDFTIDDYKQEFPDAPLLSEAAKERLEKRKAESRLNHINSLNVVPIDKDGGEEMVPMGTLFGLGRTKAALSASGNPIMIKRFGRAKESSDLIPDLDEKFVYDVEILKNVLLGLDLNIPTYLWGHAGCHAAGAEIIMADGSVKSVEDVVVGDRLASPTDKSGYRTVLGLARGNEQMYRVTPIKGESFVVNENHILSLKTTNGPANGVVGDQIENITVKEYLKKSKYWKSYRKLWRGEYTGGVDELFDPYLIGIMLGDGSISGNHNGSPSITSMDIEILNRFKQAAEDLGCNVREYSKPNNKASQFFAQFNGGHKNPLRDKLIEAGIWGMTCEKKAVPAAYRQAGVQTRLSVLAGLLDTDGHLGEGQNFDFVSKSKQLSIDVQFLARSVGLSATLKKCEKGCQNGFVGTYWRVCVSGDISKIPTLKGVNVSKRKQVKNPLVTGFNLESVGNDNFYGFCLDGDHLYMAGDFIVHHNTGKSSFFEQICAATNRPLIRIQHTINTEESHIVGQWTVKNGSTEFELGPLAIAMKHGYIYMADEYDFALPSVLSVYQSVLEGKSLMIKEADASSRVIKPHPNFRFVATGNTNGSGDETGLYQGTNMQNAANYDRFGIVCKVNYMPQKMEVRILVGQSEIDKEDAENLVKLAKEIRDAYDAGKISSTISPRALVNAAKVGIRRGSLLTGFQLAFGNKLSEVDQEICTGLAQRVLG